MRKTHLGSWQLALPDKRFCNVACPVTHFPGLGKPDSSTPTSQGRAGIRSVEKRKVGTAAGNTRSKEFHGRRKTRETRSTRQNRYQEALRKRPNHNEGSRIGCSIFEGSLVRPSLGRRDRGFHLQGN